MPTIFFIIPYVVICFKILTYFATNFCYYSQYVIKYLKYSWVKKIDLTFHKRPQTHNTHTRRGNDHSRAISRTTLHIPFNFIRGLGELRRKYIGSYPRKLYKYCHGDICRALHDSDPWIFKCQPGSAGWQRFSASKYYFPPRCCAPSTSIVDSQEGRNTRRGRSGEGRSLHRVSLYSGAA